MSQNATEIIDWTCMIAILNLIALVQVALFPYLHGARRAKWMLAIIALPVIGSVGWFSYAAAVRVRIREIVSELAGEWP